MRIPDEQSDHQSEEPSIYRPPLATRAMILGAKTGAAVVRGIREAAGGVVGVVRDEVEDTISEGHRFEIARQSEAREQNPVARYINNLRNGIQQAVYKVMKFSRTVARDFRLIEKINIHGTPKLLSDDDLDNALKSDIIDNLDSRIGTAVPFMEEIETIARVCFDRGIPADRLVAFLESEDVLTFLVEEVLAYSHSRYRGSNIKAIVASVIDTVIYKLEHFAARKRKEPVNAVIAGELEDKIAYFKKTYDPKDKRCTVFNFIRRLKKAYPNYDVATWLKVNKSILVEMLRGRPEEQYDEETTNPRSRHVANMVDDVYEQRGQINPDQFIRLNLNKFFIYYNPSDMDTPAFIRVHADTTGIHKISKICVIDIRGIVEFFDEIMPRIQSGGTTLIELRKKIIEACEERICTQMITHDKIIVRDSEGNYKVWKVIDRDPFREAPTGTDVIDRMEFSDYVAREITASCQVISSHIDVGNLLVDPLRIPPEIRKHYEDWFTQEGDLRKGPYHQYLRGIFGQTKKQTTGTKPERRRQQLEEFETIKRRVSEIFERVNEHLASVSDNLGIPPITLADIAAINDYAELVKIACTSSNLTRCFCARRKIELAILTYTCMVTPRKVYQEHEAKEVKRVLEGTAQGIKTFPEEQVVTFLDYPDGDVREIKGDDDPASRIQSVQRRKFRLIRAQVANNINCHVLSVASEADGDEGETNPLEYIGKKSLNSMITRLLTGEDKRAKDITDLLRMTFVVESIEDLVSLQEHLENNYISFGRTLKIENRYGEFVRVQAFNVERSAAKSDRYRTLRYVIDIPIQDEAGKRVYAVPMEIRILLREDLMKERSSFHEASHEKYEKRRLKIELKRIAPPEIFPEIYQRIGPDPNDVFGREELAVA